MATCESHVCVCACVYRANVLHQIAPKTGKEHEVEIELASPIVLDQGAKAMSGAPHRYQELIEGFLDNVRVLARKARDFS